MPNFSLLWPGEEVADARKDEIELSKLWERVQYWKSSALKVHESVFDSPTQTRLAKPEKKMGIFFLVRREMKQFSLRKQETGARSWSKK